MARFVKNSIVVVPFPFSDLSQSPAKKRPALVVADLDGDDLILAQITSQNSRTDRYSIELSDADLVTGSLRVHSLIRPNRLFTADSKIIEYEIGMITVTKFAEVIQILHTIFAT